MKVVHCPNCSRRMTITKLHCAECDITVEGRFHAERFSFLNEETIDFIETFILARGSITEIEKRLGISYPTVKAKIERMVTEIENLASVERERMQQEEKELEEAQKKETKLKELYRKK
jgi:hypothetical protein